MKKLTIHIFAYGEAQIIDDTNNFKTPVDKFKKLQAVVDDVKSLRPAEIGEKDYHVISIFSSGNSKYSSKEKEGSFSFDINKLNTKKFDALTKEFDVLKGA